MKYIILTINPGSTSTKIALYKGKDPIFTRNILHTIEEINNYEKVTDQFLFRMELILNSLNEEHIELSNIDIILGRGGLIRPVKSGVYKINSQMIEDLKANLQGEHASNLGGLLAHELSKQIGCPAYIADPVVVDELDDIARYSGYPGVDRRSVFHALNQKATARLYAEDCGIDYEALNLIVVHMGGGISVAAHRKGRVVDVNDGLNGEGPFTPERTGGLTLLSISKLCFSNRYTFNEIKKLVAGKGGLTAYLGTNSVKEVDEAAENGDKKSLDLLNAMSYQIAKEIGAMATVLEGKVDAILLTGGVAHCQRVTDFVTKHVTYIAPVHIYPGEDEMKALALNGLRVLTGETIPLDY